MALSSSSAALLLLLLPCMLILLIIPTERMLQSYRWKTSTSNNSKHVPSQHHHQRQQQQHHWSRERYNYKAPTSRNNTTNDDIICGDPPDYNVYFNQSYQHRSVNKEDETIYRLLFRDNNNVISNGTYVELGAFDGKKESNTRFFDECLGWNGLLIEGNPAKYDDLQRNRPHAHKLSFAPSCRENNGNQTVDFHAVAFTNAGVPGHAKAYEEGWKVVKVPCGSLTPVLLDLLDGHVDFFSLDVEGSEPLVLDTIDFDRVSIQVLMVESWNAHCPRNQECESRSRVRQRLKDVGYRRYSNVISKSDLYIHPESKFQLPKEKFTADA